MTGLCSMTNSMRRQYVSCLVNDWLYFLCKRGAQHHISSIYARFVTWFAHTHTYAHTNIFVHISNDLMMYIPLLVIKRSHCFQWTMKCRHYCL